MVESAPYPGDEQEDDDAADGNDPPAHVRQRGQRRLPRSPSLPGRSRRARIPDCLMYIRTSSAPTLDAITGISVEYEVKNRKQVPIHPDWVNTDGPPAAGSHGEA